MKAIDWMDEVKTEETGKESGIAQVISRTRDFQLEHPWSGKITWPDGRSTRISGTHMYQLSADRISYENTKYQRYGNCSHSKKHFIVHSGSGPVTVFVGDGKSDPALAVKHAISSDIGWLAASDGNRLQPWKSYPHVATHLAYSLDPLDIDSLLARAIKEMKPEIKSELSLLVSLAELGDLRAIVETPLKVARRIQKSIKKGTFRDIAKAVLKGSSDTYLTHVFGTKQLFNDLSGIVNTVCTVDEQLGDLISKVNSVQVRHWSPPDVSAESKDTQFNIFDANWAVKRDWSTGVTRRFTVTMKYTYDLTDALGNPLNLADLNLLRFGAYLDKFGLKWDPSTIWDLIPFSFIVDWFIGIGDWLGSFKRNNLTSRITILDMCYSTKTQVTSDFRTTRFGSFPGQTQVSASSQIVGESHCVLSEKTYERRRCYPKASWIFGTATPDIETIRSNQLITGAALITSNLLR